MILIGLGGNLPSNVGAPDLTIAAAIDALAAAGLVVEARSRDYRSAPVPISDQPWYVNAVIAVATTLPPDALLALLHRVEAGLGRKRREVNGARTLDLDLLAYEERVQAGGDGTPVLPHPRLHQRAFVLLPLAEIAPGWRHPITGDTVEQMIANLPPDQTAEPI